VSSGASLRQLQILFDVGTVAGLSDGQLLERFVASRGASAELAFAAMVERHGPMVLRVCRRALADRHAADDAFQATFLVLVRRAGAIQRGDSLASWLHGVALRVASCSRSAANRRRAHERRRSQGISIAVFDPGSEADELGRALHEELGRLPGRFRDVAVFCLLEGCTQEEAAIRLGCPVGTVKSRLATAREKLKCRLARRGLAPMGGGTALTAALASEAEAAGVAMPLKLVESTIGYAACHATAGVVPASVAALSREVLHAMLFHKIKALAAGSMALGILGVGVVWAQDSAPTPRSVQSRDDDRLREVERKLDRVLEALGNSSATTQRNGDMTRILDQPQSDDVAARRPSNNRPTAVRPRATKPAAPASTPYDTTVGRNMDIPGVPPAAGMPLAPPTAEPPSTTVYATPPHPQITRVVPATPAAQPPPPPAIAPPARLGIRVEPDRLSRVEGRLAALEQRIAAIEQRLNRDQPPAQVSEANFPDINYTTRPNAEVPVALPTPAAASPFDSGPPPPASSSPDVIPPPSPTTPTSAPFPPPPPSTDAPPTPGAPPTESTPRPVREPGV
jgi:RNA polymerase sigma factor (sigma-70 family)